MSSLSPKRLTENLRFANAVPGNSNDGFGYCEMENLYDSLALERQKKRGPFLKGLFLWVTLKAF
ncbi:MAG: hypothetical protein B7Y25_02240 [Alphaproteobacteria bacterium 16-39-46]|nr:MAG: hypothetical protein B7Y25_02240 [Alphaproteobacteria bacterium 16-39-46]OZA43668.1 MAG: hypothetical protein B7X84_02510 [Alphaproteobacteria bacterium 17-39-52]